VIPAGACCFRAAREVRLLALHSPLVLRSAVALVALAGAGAAPVEPAARCVRLRFEWTSNTPQIWAGVLETSQGTIVQPASLGTEPDDPGTLWADGKNLWLERRTPRNGDGFDVTVISSASDRLSFTLQSAQGGHLRPRCEFTLSDVENKSALLFRNSTARLAVRRAPGDALRVAICRPHLVFRSGEEFSAVVAPNPISPVEASADMALLWKVSSSDDAKESAHGLIAIPRSAATPRMAIPVQFPLPEKEGSYDLRFQLTGFGSRKWESSVQVVVVSDRPASRSDPLTARETVVDQFRPAEPNVLDHAVGEATWSHDRVVREPFAVSIAPGAARPQLLRCLDSGTLSEGVNGAVKRDLQEWVPDFPAELPVPGWAPPARWSAYRLRLKHPQRPHRLCIEIAQGSTQFVGISVLEPNAGHPITAPSLDTGVVIDSSPETTSPRGVVRHEFLFWPRICEPILLLHDMGTGRRFDVSQVEIRELSSLDQAMPARAPERFSKDAPSEKRLIGPYLEKPLLAENFGGPTTIDRANGRSLDDWRTFHAAAVHMAAYLRFHGYNSLLLGALADGSTIYPSALLEPGARYDDGCLFSTGQDPMRKDFLELLYRVFDREHLVLIPELQFSSPLPALERQLLANAPASEGIELIGRDGRSWRESRGTVRGLAPEYNPLDPRVQDAVVRVVRELVERYREHAAFAGIAMEVSANGYLQLPGLQWGYDDATIARFKHDTAQRIQDGSGRDRYRRRYDVLTGELRPAWIRWRCQELAKFQRRLSDVVTNSSPRACLILSCKNVLGFEAASGEVPLTIQKSGRLGDRLLEAGLDFSLVQNVPRLVVLRPLAWRISPARADNLLDDAVNYNDGFASAFSAGECGVLSEHVPRECRVDDSDELSLARATSAPLAVIALPAGIENRRRFAHAMASSDAQMIFDGGLTVPLGHENETRTCREIVEALPRIPFYAAELGDQGIVVRVAHRDKKTYLYAVNRFAEPAGVTIKLSCPPETRCDPLGPSRPPVMSSGVDGTSRLEVLLDGFALAAWELELDDVRVRGVEAQPTEAALASMGARIQAFQVRLAELRKMNGPTRSGTARDAATDKGDSAAPPAHDVAVSEADYWTADGAQSRDGRLTLAVGQDSRRFVTALPQCGTGGRLVVRLRVRGNAEMTSARLSFETTIDGVTIARSADVVAGVAWRRFEFRIEDLPAGHSSGSRLRIESLGSGRIWADDISVVPDGLSSDDLRQLAKISVEIALAWEEKRFAECQRLLDGYWGRYLLECDPGLSSSPIRNAAAEDQGKGRK
jgi:Glycosyl hydrolase-like 10